MPVLPETIQFTADRGDARLRLDQAIARRITCVARLSRNRVQGWIDAGIVAVDGLVVTRAAMRVREGATVSIALPDEVPRRTKPAPESLPLDIIYQDDDLMAINKPAGVVVHPSYRNSAGTMLNAVLGHLRDRADVRPGIITRLDKDTSGLVLVALNPGIHRAIQRDAAAGLVTKEYLAIVRGSPKPGRGTIQLSVARDPLDRRRMIVSETGALSETRYEVTYVFTPEGGPEGRSTGGPACAPTPWRRSKGPPLRGTHSLMRCELVTGRTHQIRVHLAACGWPILGDCLYGEPDAMLARQALHAWRVTLPHPTTRQPLQIEAALPADLRDVFDFGSYGPQRHGDTEIFT